MTGMRNVMFTAGAAVWPRDMGFRSRGDKNWCNSGRLAVLGIAGGDGWFV